MTALPALTTRTKVIDLLWDLLLIAVGSIISAAAINGILIPHRFISGGITGLVLIVNAMIKELPFTPL